MKRNQIIDLSKLVFVAVSCVLAAANATPVDDLQPGHWYEAPNSQLLDVTPTPVPPGVTGVASIMDAWSGGAYDTQRDRLIVWGGGHTDYSGNELYVFDIETLTWTRLTDPTYDVGGGAPYYNDGSPRSRHSYDYLQYLPTIDRFCSLGVSAIYVDANNFPNVDCFNFDTLQWERRADLIGVYTYGMTSDVDPSTGYAWHHSTENGYLTEYRPVQDRWVSHGSRDIEGRWIDNEITGVVHPVEEQFVAVGLGNVYVWNLGGGTRRHTLLQTTGGDPIVNEDSPGLQYDPTIDKIVGWAGGADVYTLDLNTAVWTRIEPAATNATVPTAAEARGTFGRFRYIPSKNVYVLVNRVNENVYFYKLSAAAGVPQPVVQLSANPSSVPPQGRPTLTWSSTNADSCAASGAWSGNKNTSGSEEVGPLTSDSEFILSCSNSAGGSASASVTVIVPGSQPAPTASLTATPDSITEGGFSTLDWTATNSNTCDASDDWTGLKPTQGSESVGPLFTDSSFFLTCNGPGGSGTASAAVQVVPPGIPTISLSANPQTILAGGRSTMSWAATSANSCNASGGWTGIKALTGNESVGPLSNNSSFTLTCAGAGGSNSRTTAVAVNPAGGPGGGAVPSGGGGAADAWLLALMIPFLRIPARAS